MLDVRLSNVSNASCNINLCDLCWKKKDSSELIYFLCKQNLKIHRK